MPNPACSIGRAIEAAATLKKEAGPAACDATIVGDDARGAMLLQGQPEHGPSNDPAEHGRPLRCGSASMAGAARPDDLVPGFMRAAGEVRARFSRSGERTAAARVFERGGLRLRFPKAADECEAVIINTGGGMAGGDSATLRFEAAPGAAVTLTTQSAEKIYRSQGPPTDVGVALVVEAGATMAFLPQETILFDAARLSRRFEADMAADASLTIVEAVVFGRLAMGERRPSGSFRDRWRIRRGGALVFAEDVRLDGDIAAVLDRPACGAGARSVATFVHLAPDAEARLDGVRAVLACHAGTDVASTDLDPLGQTVRLECGASAWNDVLIARFASASPERVRTAVAGLLEAFRGRPVPRVWQ